MLYYVEINQSVIDGIRLVGLGNVCALPSLSGSTNQSHATLWAGLRPLHFYIHILSVSLMAYYTMSGDKSGATCRAASSDSPPSDRWTAANSLHGFRISHSHGALNRSRTLSKSNLFYFRARLWTRSMKLMQGIHSKWLDCCLWYSTHILSVWAVGRGGPGDQ